MANLNRKKHVGYGKEATRGTAVAPTGFFLLKEPASLQVKNVDTEEDGITGAFSGHLDSQIAQQYVEGDLVGELDPNAEMCFRTFVHVLGEPTTTSGSGGEQIHTLDLNTSETPTATIVTNVSDQEKQILGTHFESLEIDISDSETSIKTSVQGRGEESTSAPTVSITPNTSKLLAKHFQCKIADTMAGLSSGVDMKIQKLNLKASQGSKIQNCLGQIGPDDIHSTKPMCEITFTGIVRSAEWYAMHIDNEKKAFQFKGVGTNYASIGSGSAKPTIDIQTPPSSVRVTFQRDKDDVLKFEAKIKTEWDWTELTHLRVIITNALTA